MTRMWGVPPSILCRQHLLGEHAELHSLVGYIRSDRDWSAKLETHAEKGEIDTGKIQVRHDRLATEMADRGYNHDSPMEYDDGLALGGVDYKRAYDDLHDRCGSCRRRMLRQYRQSVRSKPHYPDGEAKPVTEGEAHRAAANRQRVLQNAANNRRF